MDHGYITNMIVIQIIIALIIIGLVLLQQRGTGLGASWGGSGVAYGTKRGAEKFIFYLTIFSTLLFVILALINLLVK